MYLSTRVRPFAAAAPNIWQANQNQGGGPERTARWSFSTSPPRATATSMAPRRISLSAALGFWRRSASKRCISSSKFRGAKTPSPLKGDGWNDAIAGVGAMETGGQRLVERRSMNSGAAFLLNWVRCRLF